MIPAASTARASGVRALTWAVGVTDADYNVGMVRRTTQARWLERRLRPVRAVPVLIAYAAAAIISGVVGYLVIYTFMSALPPLRFYLLPLILFLGASWYHPRARVLLVGLLVWVLLHGVVGYTMDAIQPHEPDDLLTPWPAVAALSGAIWAATIGGPCALAGVIMIIALRRAGHGYPRGHCQRCGYNLTGNTSGRCPECRTRTSLVQSPEDPAS